MTDMWICHTLKATIKKFLRLMTGTGTHPSLRVLKINDGRGESSDFKIDYKLVLMPSDRHGDSSHFKIVYKIILMIKDRHGIRHTLKSIIK